ncbi:MAG: uracil-DNA glycosylase [Vicingaceae bacterium]
MASQIQINPSLEESWKKELQDEFQADYFKQLKAFLIDEYEQHTVFPPKSQILRALDHTPFQQVKVVILGQDPYHGDGQANGLCFSVKKGVTIPPSLKNIFKEIKSDLGYELPDHGDLTPWADNGVLLLNATLTVRKGQAGSHHQKGWERFTDAVIQSLDKKREGLIFLLWGKKAQDKAHFIDKSNHHVLTAAHPSPFSAYNGFMGCRHFSKANQLLAEANKSPIDWQIK